VDVLGQEKTSSMTNLQKSVTISIVPVDAGVQQELVSTVSTVSSAVDQDITKRAANSKLVE
jgi:hypothetical protein